MVSLDTNIHDVIVDVSANQLSENHKHLRPYLVTGVLILQFGAYDWGCIETSDFKLSETVTNRGRSSKEDCIGNLRIMCKVWQASIV